MCNSMCKVCFKSPEGLLNQSKNRRSYWRPHGERQSAGAALGFSASAVRAGPAVGLHWHAVFQHAAALHSTGTPGQPADCSRACSVHYY